MSLADYAEPELYHDRGVSGFFSIRCDGRQDSYRLRDLPEVLERLPRNADVALSQADFARPNRRLVNLQRLGLCFADLDLYQVGMSDMAPDHVVRSLLLHCDDTGTPRPSLVNFSGRGQHIKWLFDTALPGAALPRWNAVQKALGDRLLPFGADRVARDGSRLLRLVGTINPRSGQKARTLWIAEDNGAPVRWDFEELCREVLPKPREECRPKAKTTTGVRTGTARNANLWTARQLWWSRLDDMRKLITLRHLTGGVPVGYRDSFLFVGACSVAYGAGPANLEAEVRALAEEFCPTLPQAEVRSITQIAVARVRAGTRYKFSSSRLIEFLEVQPSEQAHLKTIIDPDESRRRTLAHDRERNRKNCDRATYEAQAQARREQARTLRAQGLSYKAIAAQMGCTVNAVDKLLRQARA